MNFATVISLCSFVGMIGLGIATFVSGKKETDESQANAVEGNNIAVLTAIANSARADAQDCKGECVKLREELTATNRELVRTRDALRVANERITELERQ